MGPWSSQRPPEHNQDSTPIPANDSAPGHTNVWTDATVNCNDRPWLCLSAAPPVFEQRRPRDRTAAEPEDHSTLGAELGHHEQYGSYFATSKNSTGRVHSSTRAEILGIMLAACSNLPLHRKGTINAAISAVQAILSGTSRLYLPSDRLPNGDLLRALDRVFRTRRLTTMKAI